VQQLTGPGGWRGSADGFPLSDGLVAAAACEQLAIHAERHAEYLVGVAGEGFADGAAGAHVPQSDGSGVVAGGDNFANFVLWIRVNAFRGLTAIVATRSSPRPAW
jgi:hypothetical protein